MANPNHDPHSGEFASGHNAGKGNRAAATHVKEQHKGGVLHMVKNFLFSKPKKKPNRTFAKSTFSKKRR